MHVFCIGSISLKLRYKKNCGPYKTASNNSGDVCNKDKLMHSLSKIYAINVVKFGMLKMCRVYKIKAVAV